MNRVTTGTRKDGSGDYLGFLESGDVDAAVEVVKSAKSEEELLEIEQALLVGNRRVSLLHIEYVQGLVNWRLGRVELALKHYLAAANGGMFSGFYCAAMIIEDLQNGSSSESRDLLGRAETRGHVWSKLILMNEARRCGSIGSVLSYYYFRFFVAPSQILVHYWSSERKERLRY